MGWAARANPRAPDGHKDTAAVYAAQLQATVRQLKTPRQYQRFLASFPADTREDVRQLTKAYCEWDLDAIRAEDALIARAATVAAQTAGGA